MERALNCGVLVNTRWDVGLVSISTIEKKILIGNSRPHAWQNNLMIRRVDVDDYITRR